MEYIRSLEKSDDKTCFICEAARASNESEKRDRLVLWSTPQSIVIINRYPYTTGHLLIAPLAHKAELQELNDDELLDMQQQTLAAVKLLKKAMSPQGFNIGINLGRCAGAGLPGHIHQHVVPQAIEQLYDELMKALKLAPK